MTVDDRDQSGGTVFADADLLPFVNSALLDLNFDLIAAGVQVVKNETTVTVRANTDTTIIFSAVNPAPTLPDDFLEPLTLWEKLSTDPARNYVEMDQRPERLPDLDATDRLRFWMWQNNQIVLIGATTDRSVRILYNRQVTNFAVSSDIIPFPGARDVLAYDALRKCGLSRGDTAMAGYADGLYQKAYTQYKRIHVKANQRRAQKRPAYSTQRPYRW